MSPVGFVCMNYFVRRKKGHMHTTCDSYFVLILFLITPPISSPFVRVRCTLANRAELAVLTSAKKFSIDTAMVFP